MPSRGNEHLVKSSGGYEHLVKSDIRSMFTTSQIQTDFRSSPSVTAAPLTRASEPIKRVNLLSHTKLNNNPTTPNINAGFTTCYSLTQNPLPETTLSYDSVTQYPLYDTRNYKTLTQYPLLDSDIRTPASKELLPLVTPQPNKLDTLAEQSIRSEPVEENFVRENGQEVVSRGDSVEQEFHLEEAPIATFESPTKDFVAVRTNSDDVFHTPNTSLQRIDKQDISLVSPPPISNATDNKQDRDRQSISTVSSAQNGNELNVNDLLSSKSLSEGEIEKDAPVNDVMTKYMEMVLQKREQEEKERNGSIDTQVSMI